MNIKEFTVGSLVEAKDFLGHWLKATVIEADEVNRRVKVHYNDQDARFDDWLSLSDGAIKLIESAAKTNGVEEVVPEEQEAEEAPLEVVAEELAKAEPAESTEEPTNEAAEE